MPWEESHRKEQIFRKVKTNREAILKRVEDEDGTVSLIFSLKNSNSVTELSLTIEEWKSILSFLNKTSERITEEIDEKILKTKTEPIIEPTTELIQESIPETITVDAEVEANSQPIPVPEITFEELEAEMQKIQSIAPPEAPVVPSEEEITKATEPLIETTEEMEEQPQDEYNLKLSAESIQENFQAEELEDTTQAESENTTLQDVPKISEPSKNELESLITPVQQPKISLIDEFEEEKVPPQLVPLEFEVPEKNTETSQISAEELLNDIQSTTSDMQHPDIILPLGKDDSQLKKDEKEANIIAAMEEVAALMPPGPAKQFVEEMMLKRTEQNDNQRPRIPQKNDINENSEKN